MQMVSCSVGDDSSWKESKMFNVNFSYLGLRLKKKKKQNLTFCFLIIMKTTPEFYFLYFDYFNREK